MPQIDYFKTQAKKLFKDYRTQSTYTDEVGGFNYFTYSPKFFDIDRIFLEYDWDEENFTLMKAQHLFALLVGFEQWGDLVQASSDELELAKLLWENQHKIHLEEWGDYISQVEADKGIKLTASERLDLFANLFVKVDEHSSPFGDYRLKEGKN
ncbi:MAG: hypothetical protein DSY83_06450 [Flavobacteriia bacterium]|nr:MAG: hypothetical protein DSY83_06450 [Flavobacteriia bacterium]